MRFLLLTGLSGAGKTAATRYLEDMGAFCVDNLPPMMIFKFMEACENSGMTCPLVAFAVDVRSAAFFNAYDVSNLIEEVRSLGYDIETVFLEASDDVLVSRYKETRREHPLANEHVTLTEAIAQERERTQPLRETANHLIDTSTLKPRQLQAKLLSIVKADGAPEALRVEVTSFGFKRGLPRQADLVYDVRFLPNPFYIPHLAHQTGLDAPVKEFVLGNEVTRAFLEKLTDMVAFLLPHYQEEGKHRLVIAIGCTGGAHRSVAIAQALGEFLADKGVQVAVAHRDLALEQAHWAAGEDN